jgi:hypothetical protein
MLIPIADDGAQAMSKDGCMEVCMRCLRRRSEFPSNANADSGQRRASPLVACVLAACLPVACSIVQPIKLSANDAVFPRSALSAACAASATCRDQPPAEVDVYVGDLGPMLWRVDQRRIELEAEAAKVTNTTTTYNALLWPLAGLAILSKLNTPSESLLGPTALAATSYGFLSSGIPQREKLYLLSSRILACAVLGSSVYRYRREEISNTFSEGRTWRELEHLGYAEPTLDSARNGLAHSMDEYRFARQRLIASLPPPQAAATAHNAAERRSRTLRGEGGGGGSSKGRLAGIAAHGSQQLETAQGLLNGIDGLRRRVLGEADLLRARWLRVEHGLHFELTVRAPELARLQSVLDAFKADGQPGRSPEAASASSGTGQAGAADPGVGDWTLPPELARGLRGQQQRGPREAFDRAALAMQQAAISAQRWVRYDRGRSEAMRSVLKKQGCDADAVISLPPMAPPAAAPAPAPAAPAPTANPQRPTTPATPSGTPLSDLGEG